MLEFTIENLRTVLKNNKGITLPMLADKFTQGDYYKFVDMIRINSEMMFILDEYLSDMYNCRKDISWFNFDKDYNEKYSRGENMKGYYRYTERDWDSAVEFAENTLKHPVTLKEFLVLFTKIAPSTFKTYWREKIPHLERYLLVKKYKPKKLTDTKQDLEVSSDSSKVVDSNLISKDDLNITNIKVIVDQDEYKESVDGVYDSCLIYDTISKRIAGMIRKELKVSPDILKLIIEKGVGNISISLKDIIKFKD